MQRPRWPHTQLRPSPQPIQGRGVDPTAAGPTEPSQARPGGPVTGRSAGEAGSEIRNSDKGLPGGDTGWRSKTGPGGCDSVLFTRLTAAEAVIFCGELGQGHPGRHAQRSRAAPPGAHGSEPRTERVLMSLRGRHAVPESLRASVRASGRELHPQLLFAEHRTHRRKFSASSRPPPTPRSFFFGSNRRPFPKARTRLSGTKDGERSRCRRRGSASTTTPGGSPAPFFL